MISRRNKYSHSFISPSGVVYNVTGTLAAFCRDHGLDRNIMGYLTRGKCKVHRGWTVNTVNLIEDTPLSYDTRRYRDIISED